MSEGARVGIGQPLPVEIVRDRITRIAIMPEIARLGVVVAWMADDKVFAVRRRIERGDELFDIIALLLRPGTFQGLGRFGMVCDAARVNDT